jgi:preprotein translocase subunit SecE
MAKNKKMPTKENAEIEKSNEVLTEVSKKDIKKQAKANEQAKASKQSKQNKKKAKNDKPKRNRVKETISELKKVSWPSFKQTCKQTGTVLVVVAVFMLVVLGIDSLLTWIISLIMNI